MAGGDQRQSEGCDESPNAPHGYRVMPNAPAKLRAIWRRYQKTKSRSRRAPRASSASTRQLQRPLAGAVAKARMSRADPQAHGCDCSADESAYQSLTNWSGDKNEGIIRIEHARTDENTDRPAQASTGGSRDDGAANRDLSQRRPSKRRSHNGPKGGAHRTREPSQLQRRECLHDCEHGDLNGSNAANGAAKRPSENEACGYRSEEHTS